MELSALSSGPDPVMQTVALQKADVHMQADVSLMKQAMDTQKLMAQMMIEMLGVGGQIDIRA